MAPRPPGLTNCGLLSGPQHAAQHGKLAKRVRPLAAVRNATASAQASWNCQACLPASAGLQTTCHPVRLGRASVGCDLALERWQPAAWTCQRWPPGMSAPPYSSDLGGNRGQPSADGLCRPQLCSIGQPSLAMPPIASPELLWGAQATAQARQRQGQAPERGSGSGPA